MGVLQINFRAGKQIDCAQNNINTLWGFFIHKQNYLQKNNLRFNFIFLRINWMMKTYRELMFTFLCFCKVILTILIAKVNYFAYLVLR